jgi:hypothetical protein
MTESKGAPGKMIFLGACLIAAVRLAREGNWGNSPRVAADFRRTNADRENPTTEARRRAKS